MVKWSWEINLGTVIALFTTMVALTGAYYKLRERLLRVEVRLQPIIHWWDRKVDREVNGGTAQIRHEAEGLRKQGL